MKHIKPIHPFPARMAPEIALSAFASLGKGVTVLDPMAGSGTVLRMASEYGHRGIGFDVDPLSVIQARVWTTPINITNFQFVAASVIDQARAQSADSVSLPWIDDDPETRKFIDFWFAEKQRNDLRALSRVLLSVADPYRDVLRLAVSRLIITKQRGASLGGDVSHSRPHRIRETNDFDVLKELKKSIDWLVKRMEDQKPPGNVEVRLGDARNLVDLESNSIDAVITSPPYLNAIDYLRGHRLALVWFGYCVGELRTIRAESVGSERKPDPDYDPALAIRLSTNMGEIEKLPERQRGMIDRYTLDMYAVMLEVSRVLKTKGKAVFVVGNSCLRGIYIENTQAVSAAAEEVGLRLMKKREREIPPARRYLPPPTMLSKSDLSKRMRTEAVLTFSKV